MSEGLQQLASAEFNLRALRETLREFLDSVYCSQVEDIDYTFTSECQSRLRFSIFRSLDTTSDLVMIDEVEILVNSKVKKID